MAQQRPLWKRGFQVEKILRSVGSLLCNNIEMIDLERQNQNPLSELEQKLLRYGVDISSWGKGQTKTLEDLLKEIKSGETTLEIDENGALVRRLVVDNINIFYIDPFGKRFHLKEKEQVFKDGRVRVRKLEESIFEKIKSTEDPQLAAIRGLEEELGVTGEINLEHKKTKSERIDSPSYPTLQSEYLVHMFEVTLSDEQYKAGGYVEEQPDKNTYFVWEEVK